MDRQKDGRMVSCSWNLGMWVLSFMSTESDVVWQVRHPKAWFFSWSTDTKRKSQKNKYWMLFLVANFSGHSVQPQIQRGREKVFETFSGLTPYKYFKEMSPIFAQVKCRSIFQWACRGNGHGNYSKGLVGGWFEHPRNTNWDAHSTLVLAEQHRRKKKKHQVVEYQQNIALRA